MPFISLPSSEHEERIQELPTAPDLSHMRPMDAPAAYRVDFYLIYMAIGVAGFKMSWTARSRTPGDSASVGAASPDAMNGRGRIGAHTTPVADDYRFSGSNLWLVPEFSTVVTSSTATHAIQWVG
jgi:hypothetical protein